MLPAIILAEPCNFYGTASVDGAAVAAGTAVTAWAENLATHEMDEVGSTVTVSVPVSGFYALVVDLNTGTHSTTIHFKIGDLWAVETATWAMYGNVERDLTAYTTPVPIVNTVDPNQGYQGQTLDVTITGANFDGATSVSFGAGITVNSFTVDSNTQITASISIAAGAALGTRDVSVTTPLGTGTLTGGFTVISLAPTVTAVDPNQGYRGDTLDVTITGTNFNGATSVSFGAGITVNDFDVDSDTQITAGITIAAGATPGTRDVSVTTPLGTGTLTGGFTVLSLAPTVTAVNPDWGRQGDTLDVTITGTNFNGATSVSFGTGITVNDFDVDSNTQITASISIAAGATLGTRNVSVTTPQGTGTLTGGFTVLSEVVPPPTVTAVDPDQGYQGLTLDITITGTDLITATSVSFGLGITVNSFTVDSNTQITASISIAAGATPGTRDVSVTTLGGTDTLEDCFTVLVPGGWVYIQLYLGMTPVQSYPGFDNDLPANLPAQAVMVWHMVTADEATPEIPAGTWLHWTRGAPPQFNSLHTLVTGKLYLVMATAACVWSVPAT
jgi:hypothetical protein